MALPRLFKKDRRIRPLSAPVLCPWIYDVRRQCLKLLSISDVSRRNPLVFLFCTPLPPLNGIETVLVSRNFREIFAGALVQIIIRL